MEFIQPDLYLIVRHFEKITSDSKPLWGSMNAQQMVEHMSDALIASQGRIELKLMIPEEQLEKAHQFLMSDKPLPKDAKAPYAKAATFRHSEIELAIDELTEEWMAFEDFFEENPGKTILHPYFGQLNYEEWLVAHTKHITHHLAQFGVTIDNNMED
jgi:hypothetical protein